jgi:hypothetical protein
VRDDATAGSPRRVVPQHARALFAANGPRTIQRIAREHPAERTVKIFVMLLQVFALQHQLTDLINYFIT